MNGQQSGGPGPEPGPGNTTQFLQLEISQMLFSEAQTMARQVALELMREAMRERLRERLGDRLAALGKLAADDLLEDLEANLTIERAIRAHKERSADVQQRLAAALVPKG
jgi:hypothetical protein